MMRPPPQVLGLQVGEPGLLPYRDSRIESSIASREAVPGPVHAGFAGFEGDRVADTTVHGGPDKAICCYPVEHHEKWASWLGVESMPYGAFGENLTLAGLIEKDVKIGDIFRVGTATVQVSQPRGPCYKLAARWGRKEIQARMSLERISGFYFRVLETGEISRGDELELIENGGPRTVDEMMRIMFVDREDVQALEAAVNDPALAEAWKHGLRKLLARRQLVLGE